MNRLVNLVLVFFVLFNVSCDNDEDVINVSSVKLSASKVTLIEGEKQKVEVKISPSNSTNIDLIWSSENKAVATVDETGMVTAVKEGETKISAESESGVKGSINIQVKKKSIDVQSIAFDKNDIQLEIGGKYELKVSFVPENASDKTLSWESSDPLVVEVDDNGVIKAIKDGDAIITAKTSNNMVQKCNVTVAREHLKGMADAFINGQLILPLNDNAITLPVSEQTEMEKKIDKYLKDVKASLPFASIMYIVTNYSDYNTGKELGDGLLVFSEMGSENVFIPMKITKKSEDEVNIKFEGDPVTNVDNDMLDKVINNEGLNKIKAELENEAGLTVLYTKVSEMVQIYRLTSNSNREVFWNFLNETW